MKTSVLDFIDSSTLREHLRNQTLEPAVECILIVQSRTRSFEEKLEALKERYETYSDDEFRKGKYNCRENDFKAALKKYIDATEKVIADMYLEEDNYIYLVLDKHSEGLFNTYNNALNAVKMRNLETECRIYKEKINDFKKSIRHTRVWVNKHMVPFEIWNHNHNDIFSSFEGAYAWIPHRYAIGDLISTCFDGNFAVVVDNGKCPPNIKKFDLLNMTLKCVTFEKKEYHSCGGIFIQERFPILRIESATAEELEKCPKELIGFRHLVKDGISAAEFLEEYSQGIIGSKS